MSRFTWVFWVAVIFALSANLSVLGMSLWNCGETTGTRQGVSPIAEYASGAISILALLTPALIGIVAGVKSFGRETREGVCTASLRIASALYATASGTPLGLLAGAVMGFIVESIPTSSSSVFEMGYGYATFPYVVLGTCYGLFVSFVTSLVFGTGLGQRPTTDNREPKTGN